MKKLVTHNGKFHTDDVLAGAILSVYLKKQGESFQFIRTRDEAVISTGDVVFDIGNIYDPETARFDHHQQGRAGERENSIPYAACGLVWKHFGLKLCTSQDVWKLVDEKLVQGIDAADNGITTETVLIPGVKKFTFGSVIDCYLPVEEDASLESYDAAYAKAVEYTEFILERVIIDSERTIKDKILARELYDMAPDKQIIVCENYIKRISKLLGVFPEPVYVIYPDQNNRWRVDAVRNSDEVFINRKDLPREWGGLRDAALQEVSGVVDATFCHPGLFTAGAVSQEGARELAKKALLM